jgi:hypothetical protein
MFLAVDVFGLSYPTPRLAPGPRGGRLGELDQDPSGFLGLLPLAGGLGQGFGDQPTQPLLAREAQQVVDAVVFAPAHQLVAAERLNLAWELLRDAEVPEVAAKLVQRCDISKRQAYRYLQMAQEMTAPMLIGDAKIPFTVKLSQSLVQRLHQYATTTGLTLSEIVSRALTTVLPRGRGRG